MRVLFLTNFYPPASRGGYEQWCQEVAIELARRGYQVQVLTSRTAGEPVDLTDGGVRVARRLHLEVEGGLLNTIQRLLKDRKKLEAANLREVRQLINNFQPDVILIWGMWNVPRSVPALVEELLPGRVAYYLCDYWLSLPNAYFQRWQEPALHPIAGLLKRILASLFLAQLNKETPIALKLEHPICVSRAVRDILVDAGVPISHAHIIYGGTQTEDFVSAAQRRSPRTDHTTKFVFIGRVVADKGVHTILQALSLIVPKNKPALAFDIFGKGDPAYETHLKQMVSTYGLEDIVTFKGSVPRSEIPGRLAQYDALIFSSEWQEPFARTVLEAMAAGLVVIGTTTGGTGEILIDGDTGLTYPAGNAEILATKIQTLAATPALKQKLAKAGQQRVIEGFTFTRMVNEFEARLQQIATKETRDLLLPSTQGAFS